MRQFVQKIILMNCPFVFRESPSSKNRHQEIFRKGEDIKLLFIY
jgi:hypothetical protein